MYEFGERRCDKLLISFGTFEVGYRTHGGPGHYFILAFI